MGLITKDTFICLDCETTGLEPEQDQIIEVAVARFRDGTIIDSFETLIDPECQISESSIAIHHITQDMVQGQPKIGEILPSILRFIGSDIIIGHGITMDLRFLSKACAVHNIPCNLLSRTYIDTLRLARLYGESPTNSLEKLREHFNIPAEGAHRAMNDVSVNIRVFAQLAKQYKTTEQLVERLKKPISLKAMPLGKHKGRPFAEIPVEYLSWASRQDFDQDLIFSIRNELTKRKKGSQFRQAANPFSEL